MPKPRAREIGIPLPGTPGKYNAITDVAGVEVGFSTIIQGEPEDYKGPESPFARTGVTAIFPRGKRRSAVFVGRDDLNGNGELTGTHWMDDSGFMHGPVMITNTHSVGVVRDATSKWMLQNKCYYPLISDGQEVEDCAYFYPAVGETWDGMLNNINGFKVKEEHAFEALNSAAPGPVREGNVGGGTAMLCHGFKGGTGTASRVLEEKDGGYTIGVLVQANHGHREELTIAGIPMGQEITGFEPVRPPAAPKPGTGSIIAIVATDAPVLPIQLSKMCRRVSIGIGKLGSGCGNGSGDIFLAFSTANEGAYTSTTSTVTLLSDDRMDPLYQAVVEAVEEAILNALCAAETMVGRAFHQFFAMPTDQVTEILKRHGRYREPAQG